MVDEYQDTNRPQYLLCKRLAERHRNLCVVGDPDQSIYKWRGADLRNILDFERDFPEADDRPARAQLPLDAGHPGCGLGGHQPEPATARRSGSGPTRRAAPEFSAFRGGDELEEADFITRTARRALHEDSEHTVAMLYRMNSQSRAIEDALMREGIAYQIVGGVRFYERKEIKDTLAYLKLIINPYDDVSLRRVINVPARGIGKGVMDGLDTLAAAGGAAAAARRRPRAAVVVERALGAHRARDRRAALPPRAAASLTAFRDLCCRSPRWPRTTPCRSPSARCSTSPATCTTCARSAAKKRKAAIENLVELVSAAREYEARDPEPSLGGFVDQLSLLSEADEEAGARDARVWMMTLHAPRAWSSRWSSSPGSRKGSSRTRARATTRRSSRRSGGSATWG